jgi:regulatory protein
MPFPRSKKLYDEAALYEYAVGALARRMRTVAELKRLMRQRNISGDKEQVIDAVVARLKEQRYLNDTHYATMYSSFRRDSDKLGRQRVISDLKIKGVHADVIEKTVATAYDGVNEEQLARQFLAKKRLKKPSSEKESARIFRALARAGFRSSTIFKILKKWDVPDELLDLCAQEQETVPE